MANDNYMPLLSMGAEGYYTADDAGPFNEQVAIEPSATQTFAAGVAFVIAGGAQVGTIDSDSPPASRFLWGNEDVASKTSRGWSITLRANAAGQLELVAAVADSAGNRIEAVASLSGAGLPGFIDRIIFATLWSVVSTEGGDNSVMLGINGNLVGLTVSSAADGYTPSPYAARLGADPVTGASTQSSDIEFIGCTYAPIPILADASDIGVAGDYCGSSWRAFYSGYGQGAFISQDFSTDWLHRYSALSLSAGVSAHVVKTNGGEYIKQSAGGYAAPGVTIPDIGNKTTFPSFVSTALPVNLTKTGTTPRLLGAKNIPYYASPAFTFPVTPEA